MGESLPDLTSTAHRTNRRGIVPWHCATRQKAKRFRTPSSDSGPAQKNSHTQKNGQHGKSGHGVPPGTRLMNARAALQPVKVLLQACKDPLQARNSIRAGQPEEPRQIA
jgi:hypothetical protein